MENTKVFSKWVSMALFLIITGTSTISFCQIEKSGQELAKPREIKFADGKWKDIAARAKKENKYIFVDAFTTWCAPCRQLKEVTFKDEAAAAYFNTHFINYTVDMEKGEGTDLAEKWIVNEYPTLLFFSPEGDLIKKQIGYIDSNKLINLGKEVRTEGSKK
ncbi:thioredoxin domain-containing protein [Niabella yanshanensis]|uniref:Thioredoxin domain-containing protein n=1 Tax=Niabella yanshanensis TaxID=577386 RepID=A0ABZ0WBR5_9BACT|nr:thioredoxin fold domain-containing protein [Niabella yanshanensis]WQD39615.1 thioredoxin domain-containing protein [Niabella yanshanensis]